MIISREFGKTSAGETVWEYKMDILTEVAAGAETTGMDVAAGWLKGNDHQANEQGKQLLEQYGYLERFCKCIYE